MSLLTLDHLPDWLLDGQERPSSKEKGEEGAIDDVPVFSRLDYLEATLRAALAALQATKRAKKVVSRGYLYFQPQEKRAGMMNMTTNMPYLFDYRYANQTRGEAGVYPIQFAYGIDGAILTDPENIFSSWKNSVQKALSLESIKNYEVSASVQAARARGQNDQYNVFYHGLIYDGPPENPVSFDYTKNVQAPMGAFYPLNLQQRNSDVFAVPMNSMRETTVFIHVPAASPDNAKVFVADPSKLAAALTVFVYHERRMIHFGIVFIVPPTMPGLITLADAFNEAEREKWTLFTKAKKFTAAREAFVQAEQQFNADAEQQKQLREVEAAAEEEENFF